MTGFGRDTLPYGVFSHGFDDPRVGVAVGDHVLNLHALATTVPDDDVARAFAAPSLTPLLGLGPAAWRAARERITSWLDQHGDDVTSDAFVPLDQARLHLPFTVADFVDFYASRHHASNAGRILRPGQAPLTPNWVHQPLGYHGRSGSVVGSGTLIRRPHGQRADPDRPAPVFGPSVRLDFEAEIGFVVGVGSRRGHAVGVDALRQHVFGLVVVNDWSARDLQAWEQRPLGPFLGKSFATSMSAWVVPMDALESAMIAPPAQDPAPLPYLQGQDPRAHFGLDLQLEVRLNAQVISRPRYAHMYWTPAQMLAHLTSGGSALRTGDLFASGTVSGPSRDGLGRDGLGCLLELTEDGQKPLRLPDNTTRGYLADHDEVTISLTCPGPDGTRRHLGEVTGQIQPAEGTEASRGGQ